MGNSPPWSYTSCDDNNNNKITIIKITDLINGMTEHSIQVRLSQNLSPDT